MAFRHWKAVPDEGYIVNIDDVVVEAQTVLGLENVVLNVLKYWKIIIPKICILNLPLI